jgi:trimethylamine-N-oxide reductase cytochrome c-type subunit TorC
MVRPPQRISGAARVWNVFAGRGPKWTLAAVGAAGVVAGVIFWGGFNTAMEATNELGFCISCHEMRDTVYQEYKTSIHYKNPVGVRAVCADCHVPKDWTHKIVRKVQASNELWHKLIGTIDTPEKFQAQRAALAKDVWRTMKETDSRECRNCHSYEAMDFEHQKNADDAQRMKKGLEEGQTCIDCHKGIAHKLPDMSTGYKAIFADLEDASKSLNPAVGATLYTMTTQPFWLEKPKDESDTSDGKLVAATPVEVVDRNGAWLKVKFSGWQQEGAERMFYAAQGKRIFAAALGPDAIDKVIAGKSMTDPDTDQKWTESSLTAWIANSDLTPDIGKLWDYGGEMYNASCGLCHTLPPPGNYLANQWIGNLNSMKRNVSLDDEQYRFLQKYVQMHAQDMRGKHE